MCRVLCCVVLCCVVLCCVVLCVVSRKKKLSSTASSGKANDWRTRERVVLDLFSNLEWERSKSFFGEPLRHVITVRGQILVIRTGDDPLPPVCRFKTFPCVPAPRPHVVTHAGVVPVHTGTF